MDALSGKLTFEKSKNRIIGRDADNVARLLILANGTDFVMKVSKDGIDVLTATDNQLIFNSGNNLPKIVHTDTFTLVTADFAASGNSYLTQLATEIIDLDQFDVINPIVWVFIENALGEVIPLPYYSFNFNTGALSYQAIASVNTVSNDLYVEIRSTAALSPGVTFRYYVLQETSA